MTGRMPVALTAGRSQMWSLLNAAPRAKARAIRVSSSCLWSPGPSTPSWSKPNSPPLTTTSSAGPKARSSTSAPMPPVSHSHSQTHNSSFFSLCRFLKGQFTQKLKSCYNLLFLSFQTGMCFFILFNTKQYILKNVGNQTVDEKKKFSVFKAYFLIIINKLHILSLNKYILAP